MTEGFLAYVLAWTFEPWRVDPACVGMRPDTAGERNGHSRRARMRAVNPPRRRALSFNWRYLPLALFPAISLWRSDGLFWGTVWVVPSVILGIGVALLVMQRAKWREADLNNRPPDAESPDH